jgi:hypothetical protein
MTDDMHEFVQQDGLKFGITELIHKVLRKHYDRLPYTPYPRFQHFG